MSEDLLEAPSTREVAAALGVAPDRLERFVDAHPDPEAPNVLGWAVADPEHEDLVAAYLEAREREKRERREKHREARRENRGLDL